MHLGHGQKRERFDLLPQWLSFFNLYIMHMHRLNTKQTSEILVKKNAYMFNFDLQKQDFNYLYHYQSHNTAIPASTFGGGGVSMKWNNAVPFYVKFFLKQTMHFIFVLQYNCKWPDWAEKLPQCLLW